MVSLDTADRRLAGSGPRVCSVRDEHDHGGKERGADRLTMESDPNAAGFYERMGARRTGSVTAPSTGRELQVYEVLLPNTKKQRRRKSG